MSSWPPPSETTAADAEPVLVSQFVDAALVDIEVSSTSHEPPAVMVVGTRPN